MGRREAKEFLQSVKRNARIMSGNKQVAQAVASGSIAFGLTDTDDAIVEIERGMPVAIVYPDQGEGDLGTLFIPNTLALIKDSPNPEAANKLVDYLLSSDVERRLADGPECADSAASRRAGFAAGEDAQRSARDGGRLVGRRREMGHGRGVSQDRVCRGGMTETFRASFAGAYAR